MASIRKLANSPFWIAKYRDGDRVRYRTTKQKNRSDAMDVAITWERQARLANAGELTQAAVNKFSADLLERLGHGHTQRQSVTEFAASWLIAGLKGEATRKRYQAVIDAFLNSLPPHRKNAGIAVISAQEIEAFRDQEMSKGKTATTADYGLKVLRALFERAKRLNHRTDNPADAVDKLNVPHRERKPFTDEQVQLLLDSCNREWRGMILFGAFAGLRLNDAANLAWGSVDMEASTLTYVPSKTALRKPEPVTIAIHPNITSYLKDLPRRSSHSPIFPTLAGRPSGSAGGLSNQFTALLVKTGIRPLVCASDKTRKPAGKRTFNQLGFHSTRHFFISKMANADVPQEVRMALAGHAADQAHTRYVHLELSTQRRALSRLGFTVD